MSNNDEPTPPENNQSPDRQSRDFWYEAIPRRFEPYEGNVDDQIKRDEANHRNKIGLTIVTTICRAFIFLLLGGLLIFGWMTYKGTPENVTLVIEFIKEYAGLLKDGFLPIVLVALGYFFGSNNSR